MKLNVKTTVPFIFALTGCTLPNLAALRAIVESPAPNASSTVSPTQMPMSQQDPISWPTAAPSASPTATASPTPTNAPTQEPTPSPVPTPTPTPKPTPTAIPQGTLTVTFDNASSPLGTIGYGENKRFANYRLMASSEEPFAITQGTFSWMNFTSQNTSLSNLALSLNSAQIATHPFLDANPLTQAFNSSPTVSENTSAYLHVDATLTDDVAKNGVNPGDVVAVALNSISAVGKLSGTNGSTNFAAPLLGNKLVVVPFAIQPGTSSPSGMQTPSSNATIGVWNIRSLLLSDFGSVDMIGIRVAISGNGGGPLKDVSLVKFGDQTNLATIPLVTTPAASLDIPFNQPVPFVKGTVVQPTLRADTIQYKQMGGYAALALSLIGYTITDRNNPSKSIFIDLSREPVMLTTLIF